MSDRVNNPGGSGQISNVHIQQQQQHEVKEKPEMKLVPYSPVSSAASTSGKPTEFSECVFERLEAENADLKKQVSLLQQQRDEQENEVKALVLEKEDVIKVQTDELAFLKAKLESMESKWQEKGEELEKVKNEAAETERKYQEEMATSKEVFEEAEKMIAELEGDNKDLKKISKRLNETLEQKEKEFGESEKRMQSEIMAIRKKRDFLRSKCEKLDLEWARAHDQATNLRKRLKTIYSEGRDLRMKLDEEKELVRQILKEEKEYRSKSTINKLILEQEVGAIDTATATAAGQQEEQRTLNEHGTH